VRAEARVLSGSTAIALRVPPHSIEAEQAVLGGLMLAPTRADAVMERLSEGDFYRRDHQAIFRAICELSGRGQPYDAVTMAEWFQSHNLSDLVGGASYVIELANATPSAANIVAYADIVSRKSTLRHLIDIATDAASAAFDGSSDGSLVDDVIGKLMALQKIDTRHEYTLRQAMTMAYKAAQEAKARGGAIAGISSGLMDLDEILGGWHDSDLTVIGARPSMGKTALLLNFAIACKVPSGIISAEQPAQQVGGRVMAIESGVHVVKMRSGNFDDDDLPRLANAVARLVETPCMVYDRSAPTIADVTRIARKWKQEMGLKILFVDYVQRIEGSDRREKKYERVGEVVRGLKDLARDLNIPVVSLGQVGRQVESRPDKRPHMGDLSDCSEIEKEADEILMLYRDEVYHEDSPDKGVAELLIEKNRHGPTGLVRSAWIAPSMRFESYAGRGYDQ
jgi:replicative DNA helicase